MKNVEGDNLKQKYEAIVFDLDGTLIDTDIDFKDMKRAIVRQLGDKFKIEFNTNQVYSARVTEILSYALNKVKDEEKAQVIHLVFEVAEKFEMPAARKAKLRDNTIYVLKELKKKGIKLAVITNEGKKVTDFLLNKFKITTYFDIIVTRDDVGALKPDPKGLLKIIESLKIDKTKVLLIGDSPIDIETAKNAGIAAWGILNGFGKKDELIEKGAERILNKIDELLDYIF